jgi:hypothetical protein
MVSSKFLVINSDMLLDYIWKKEKTPQDIANALRISQSELFDRMYIGKCFDKKEIEIISDLLDLSKVEKELIFRL